MAPCRRHKHYFSILFKLKITINIAEDEVFKQSYILIEH